MIVEGVVEVLAGSLILAGAPFRIHEAVTVMLLQGSLLRCNLRRMPAADESDMMPILTEAKEAERRLQIARNSSSKRRSGTKPMQSLHQQISLAASQPMRHSSRKGTTT